MKEIIAATRDLTKIYGSTEALVHMNLNVKRGQILGLIGDNGAGKTTLLKMLAGQIYPTRGEITLFGAHGEKELEKQRKRIGTMIESPGFYPQMSVEGNLEYYRIQKGIPGKEKVAEILKVIGLYEKRKAPARKLSFGMKQRLGLAAALLGYPKLLILDEPTNGLDPAGIQEMRELICSLPERFGMTVVVSSHLLSEIDQMADHVAIIREGELVFQDTLETLHGRSRHHLALRTTNNAVARAILQEKSVPCQEEEGYLILPILSDELAGQFTRLLGARNLGVIRLEERQKSLEDIFLELTGKAASL